MPNYSAYPPKIRAIIEPLSQELVALFDEIAAGRIAIDAWQYEVERLLAKNITAAFMAGRGKFSLNESEITKIREWVSKQARYLESFAVDIATHPDDEEFTQKWRNRAASYATSIVNPFYSGETWGIPLPAIPGDMTSQCGQADKCSWHIVKLEGEGNWDATWRLHPAEHCQTCLERARLWKPLQIRNYQLLIPDGMLAKELAEMVKLVQAKSHHT